MKPLPALLIALLFPLGGLAANDGMPRYRDPAQPVEVRIQDLVSRLTLEEKVALLQNTTPGVPRLGMPKYDWWNESLHGVARAGEATVFPQAIGLAAMWDEVTMQQVAHTIGVEARAKFNGARGTKDEGMRYYGLTFWTPNINIFRDPRWGRGQETYGEDPFLTARTGVAFVRGLQGDDPRHLMAAACAKHFAVHSGPESLRHHFNVSPPEADLYETYLPAFEAFVREGKVEAVMTAYNSLYDTPAPISPLLHGLLAKWGFAGHITSDCGSITDLHTTYKTAADLGEAEALALKAGLNVRCGDEPSELVQAVKRGQVSEAQIDQRLGALVRTHMRLGFYDPADAVPFNQISPAENMAPAHTALALEAARKSLVLLKNDGTLPLQRSALQRVAVIGPSADSVPVLLGNYNGTPAAPVTILAGIKAALGPGVAVDYAQGCDYAAAAGVAADDRDALAVAANADVIVYVGGLSALLEGEEMEVDFEGFHRGDRTTIELPAVQQALLEKLQATGKPLVFVNLSGSAIAMPWAAANVNAILQAWYPGQAAGTAVADVLFGDYNPAGRLPVTFYRATTDLPDFQDYAMASGHTYRYFKGQPLYAFGHGLSYTHFKYAKLRVKPATGGALTVTVNVTNTGKRDGEEVVQLYAVPPAARENEALCGFARVALKAGEKRTVTLTVPATALRRWSVEKKDYIVPAGSWQIRVGASSADIRQKVKVKL